MYLIAKTAYKGGPKVSTIKLYSEISKLGLKVIELWFEYITGMETKKEANKRYAVKTKSLEDWIQMTKVKIYSIEPDIGDTLHKINGKELWDQMQNCEDLKKQMTLALLKT